MKYWQDLEDGQEIKVLQDIYELETVPIINIKYSDVFITGEQLKNGFNLIAKAGDIGVWDRDGEYLEFSIDESGNFYNLIPIEDKEFEIDEKIFEIITD